LFKLKLFLTFVQNFLKELASLGLDRLKSALMALGLKCGGTLEERAIRLFQTKGKRLQDLDPSLFAKTQQITKKSMFVFLTFIFL
jgi:hypothetical protein